MNNQLYKWVREKQYTDYGPFKAGDVFDPGERGIHPDIITNWERDGWCEKVKPAKKKSIKKAKVKSNGRHREKSK